MTLGEYLLAAARRPLEWGVHDCCTYMADWVVLRGNPDPMAYLRGRYNRSEFAAMRTIALYGGLVAAATRGMIEALVPEADEARAGDVGVIIRPTRDSLNQACAIFSGERWVSLGLYGIDSGPAATLKIWRP